MEQSVHEALDEAKRLAHRIQPPLLETGGLAAALRAGAVNAGIRARIDVADARIFPPEVASTAYACCLAVLERARPGTVASISLEDADGTLLLAVAASTDSPTAARDAILDGLRDRVEAVGGELTASTEGGGRLRLSASLPWPE